MSGEPEISSYKRPADMKVGWYCASCLVTLQKIINVIGSRKGEADYFDATHELCQFGDPGLFNTLKVAEREFRYPRRDLTAGCDAILQGYEEDLEKFFIGRATDDRTELMTAFCGSSTEGNEPVEKSVSNACRGVNMDDLQDRHAKPRLVTDDGEKEIDMSNYKKPKPPGFTDL